MSEGSEGKRAGGVVEESDEVAAAPASVIDRRAVHGVADPQLAG